MIGSVVAADLTGAGYQDLLVPTVHGVEVLDGRTGAEVTVLGTKFGFQNSPLVTDDPNGTVGITIAGYNGANQGVVQHYEIPVSSGAAAVGPGAWPMFHHDPQLTGAGSVLPDLGRATPSSLAAQAATAQVSLSWSPPLGTSAGPGHGLQRLREHGPRARAEHTRQWDHPVTTTNYAVTGLSNGTRYYFEVTAVNPAGEGAPSNEASAVPAAPPAAPASVSAAAGNAQVSLSWSPPATNGGAPVTGYNVYLSTTAGPQGHQDRPGRRDELHGHGLAERDHVLLRGDRGERGRRRSALGPGRGHPEAPSPPLRSGRPVHPATSRPPPAMARCRSRGPRRPPTAGPRSAATTSTCRPRPGTRGPRSPRSADELHGHRACKTGRRTTSK